MIDFNLEYCRAFYYVARLESITKAAEALFLSQPAVSRSIKRLEEHVQCRLFTRTSRGVRLTHEGALLFSHVSNAFDELMAGQKELSLLANYAGGKLAIGATETALHYFLLPKIEQFRNVHPKVYIHVTGSSTPETLQMLREGKVDMVAGVSPVSDTGGLDVVELLAFHDVFVVGPQYGDLSGRMLSAREICEYPIATVEKETSARTHIDHWFERQGILFNPEYVVRTSTAVVPFAERNLAIGIVPFMFVREQITKKKLFQIQLATPISPRYVLLIFKRDSRMSALCREFISFLSEE